jgi:hypothetical protein
MDRRIRISYTHAKCLTKPALPASSSAGCAVRFGRELTGTTLAHAGGILRCQIGPRIAKGNQLNCLPTTKILHVFRAANKPPEEALTLDTTVGAFSRAKLASVSNHLRACAGRDQGNSPDKFDAAYQNASVTQDARMALASFTVSGARSVRSKRRTHRGERCRTTRRSKNS